MSDKIIIQYLENISGRIDTMSTEISDIKHDVQIIDEKVEKLSARNDDVEEKLSARIDDVEEKLSARIDDVEERLSARIDDVEEKLSARIDDVEERLSARINEVEETLNERIDLVERALDTEIDSVYKIACENKQNIELLLIPFNDRNLYVSAEVSKIPQLDERLDEVEDKIGQHSEEIRKLKTALAV